MYPKCNFSVSNAIDILTFALEVLTLALEVLTIALDVFTSALNIFQYRPKNPYYRAKYV